MKKGKRHTESGADDAFDVFQFRPVTEGLGFKKESKLNKPPALPRAVQENAIDRARRERKAPAVMSQNLRNATTNSAAATPQIFDHEILHREELQSAIHISSKFISWVIDSVVVLAATLFANFCIHYLLGRKIDISLVTKSELLLSSLIPFFVAYYLFYFSLFWKATGQTLGMALMGIKLVSSDNKSVSFANASIRAVLSIFSVLSFGIFDILGLADAFSWTKIKKA